MQKIDRHGRAAVLLVGVICAFHAETLDGQTIAGQLSDDAGAPLGGAFVLVLDSSRNELMRVFPDSAGRFNFDGQNPNASWLRVELVGATFPDLAIGSISANERRSIQWRETPSLVSLQSVRAVESCVDPRIDVEVGRVWLEVKKALAAIAWGENQPRYVYDSEKQDRTINTAGIITNETVSTTHGLTVAPHLLSQPASTLSGVAWFLDDAFENDNCFSIPDPTTGAANLALSFEPRGADRVGVSGVFTVDTESAELRSISLVFGRDRVDGVASSEGRLGVSRTGDGGWVVNSWTNTVSVADSSGSRRTTTGGVQTRGRLTRVLSGQRLLYEDGRVTVLSGTVYDSTVGDVLPNAVVALAGTDQWTTTDATGAFFLAGHYVGRYELVFGHPRLDSIGFISPTRLVELTPGRTAVVELAVPPLRTILAEQCGSEAIGPLRRVLFGVVRDGAGNPVTGANVTALWQTIPRTLQGFAVDDHEATGVTDEFGTFTLCGLTVGREVVVRALQDDQTSEFVSVVFSGQNFRAGNRTTEGDRLVGRLDLVIRPLDSFAGSVSGVVVSDPRGEPVDGAEVRLAGSSRTVVTDSTGSFTIGNLPNGVHRVTARRVGFRQVRHEFELRDGEAIVLSGAALRMPSGVTELAPIVVEAEGVALADRHLANSGFFDRQQLGLGDFATRADIESWHPIETTDALRRMNGVRVIPNPSYGFGGDTRKYLIGSGRTASLSQGSFCPALVFVDGIYAGSVADPLVDIDNLISVTELGAIEVYAGPSETPARFNRPGASCGVIVFWTR